MAAYCRPHGLAFYVAINSLVREEEALREEGRELDALVRAARERTSAAAEQRTSRAPDGSAPSRRKPTETTPASRSVLRPHIRTAGAEALLYI